MKDTIRQDSNPAEGAGRSLMSRVPTLVGASGDSPSLESNARGRRERVIYLRRFLTFRLTIA